VPELPEVETVVRGLLAAGLLARRIMHVSVMWPRTLSGITPQAFAIRLKNHRVEGISRRAKYIVLSLSGGLKLFVHLRMTGNLRFEPAGAPWDKHDRVSVALDDGRELRFRDVRKFGRWTVTDNPNSIVGRLGPEPLARTFTPAVLQQCFVGRAGRLKPALLDQSLLAGIGNIYADEALFAARLHPRRCVASLTPDDIARLHMAIRTILRRGISAQGTSLGGGTANFYSVAGRRGRNQDGLQVFRRTGEPCPTCATPITRILVAQRSTHICPRCQPEHPGRRAQAARSRNTA